MNVSPARLAEPGTLQRARQEVGLSVDQVLVRINPHLELPLSRTTYTKREKHGNFRPYEERIIIPVLLDAAEERRRN